MHIGNDRSNPKYRRRRFRIKKRIETANIHSGLTFTLGGRAVSGMDVNFPLIEIANSVINVLNLYFDPTNPLSLTNQIDPTAERITKLEESAREILTHNFPTRRRGGRRTFKSKGKNKNVTRRIRT